MPTWATRQAAKFWIAGVGTATAAVLASWPEAPRWVFVVNAAIAAVGVYLVPNRDPGEQRGRHEGPVHP